MTRTLLMAALLCTAVPAVAQPYQPYPPKPIPNEPACLRPRNLYDFKIVPGNRSLVVIDLARQRYRLNFVGAAPICNITWESGSRPMGREDYPASPKGMRWSCATR